jgi:hypothetical protein
MDATVNLFNHLNILTKAGERCQGPGQAETKVPHMPSQGSVAETSAHIMHASTGAGKKKREKKTPNNM